METGTFFPHLRLLMPRVLVFDVNETLLDLSALRPSFQHLFGDADVLSAWFAQVLQTALVTTVTDTYADFSTVGAAALDVVAARRGRTLAPEDKDVIAQGMRRLPPHADVPGALQRLRDAGLRLAALTNNPQEVVDAQLEHAGLRALFSEVLSADAARRLKPAAAVYHLAAERLGVAPGLMRLVAAHDWDVTGAIRAGCAAAFVARPGMVLGPLSERPDVIGPDLDAVATRILEIEREASG